MEAPSADQPSSSNAEGVENDPRWSGDDCEALAKALRSLWEAKVRTPMGTAGAAEMASLLACPRDEVRDRALSALTSVNVVAALVFSGLLGAALEPKDVEEYRAKGDWQGRWADSMNVVVAFAATASGMVTLFSTYLILQISVEPSASGLYRSIAHMSWFFGIICTMTGVMNYILIVTFVMALALGSSSLAWRVGVALIVVFQGVFVGLFMETFSKAFPDAGITWSTLFWPFGLRQSRRDDARRAGVAKVAEAVSLHGSGVLPFADDAGQDSGSAAGVGDGKEGGASPRAAAGPPSAELRQLEQLLSAALPQATASHVEHMGAAMLRAGLTLGVLQAASGHTVALQAALDRVGCYGANLLPGEVLAIITAVAKHAATESAAGTS